MHPFTAHVPPNGFSSAIATFQPARRASITIAIPAFPVPITIRSYSFPVSGLVSTISHSSTSSINCVTNGIPVFKSTSWLIIPLFNRIENFRKNVWE
jgi:biotin transporter BioY